MKDLKITENLPNTKEWANTATRILKELIDNHNKLVEIVKELQTKLDQCNQIGPNSL